MAVVRSVILVASLSALMSPVSGTRMKHRAKTANGNRTAVLVGECCVDAKPSEVECGRSGCHCCSDGVWYRGNSRPTLDSATFCRSQRLLASKPCGGDCCADVKPSEVECGRSGCHCCSDGVWYRGNSGPALDSATFCHSHRLLASKPCGGELSLNHNIVTKGHEEDEAQQAAVPVALVEKSEEEWGAVIKGVAIPLAKELGVEIGKQLGSAAMDWVQALAQSSSTQVSQPAVGAVWISHLEGTWGTWSGTLLSAYYHPSKSHSASTDGKLGVKRSVAAAGHWAVSQQTKGLAGNKAYYNHW